MAGRPEKFTVSYFPHYVRDSKSMYIIESKYGIEGYYFWFKILELLCSSKNLFYNCNENGSCEYLQARTKTDAEKAGLILDTLANIDCIDKDLWQDRVIWCQNLVDNVSDVFKRRKNDLPQKPIIVDINDINDGNNTINVNNKPINVSTSRIIVKQRKEKKRKENKDNINIISSDPKQVRSEQPKKVEIIYDKETESFKGITRKDVELWKECYPGCDMQTEAARMVAWLKANPTKAGKRNWRKFITNWLQRSQDKGGTR
jgi:hypothetical protein